MKASEENISREPTAKRQNFPALWRHRPRALTLLVVFIVAALIVLANLTIEAENGSELFVEIVLTEAENGSELGSELFVEIVLTEGRTRNLLSKTTGPRRPC
jgi:hypothetical protein